MEHNFKMVLVLLFLLSYKFEITLPQALGLYCQSSLQEMILKKIN